MNECLQMMKEMISTNPFAIVQSVELNKKLMIESVEADEECNLWCWADEDEMEGSNMAGMTNVCLKFADKTSGQFMLVKGQASIANFFSQNMAHLCRKNKSGYLIKIAVTEIETFQKRNIYRNINILDSVKRYSAAIIHRLSDSRMVSRQAV
ncbi:MAG: hypothetical protein H7Y27_14100 [Gemmatimonadaceae bacterium]|nr:hypothetical protein [Chitinophagaceae bacterium]